MNTQPERTHAGPRLVWSDGRETHRLPPREQRLVHLNAEYDRAYDDLHAAQDVMDAAFESGGPLAEMRASAPVQIAWDRIEGIWGRAAAAPARTLRECALKARIIADQIDGCAITETDEAAVRTLLGELAAISGAPSSGLEPIQP